MDSTRFMLEISLIVICIIILVSGIYLAVIRERKVIKDGFPQLQTVLANEKAGRSHMTIGVILMILGLLGVIVVEKKFPEYSHSLIRGRDLIGNEVFVEGHVKDNEGNAVGGAMVILKESDDTGVSDPNGHFHIRLKKYLKEVSVTVVAKGYKTGPPVIEKTNTTANFVVYK